MEEIDGGMVYDCYWEDDQVYDGCCESVDEEVSGRR